MSFIHYTLVGHFDPRIAHMGHYAVFRPIDPVGVARLLAEYPPGVAELVSVRDGYACCQWVPAGRLSAAVFEFAYRLARLEGCLAIENGRQVMYPPEAARAQGEAVEQLTGCSGMADSWERQAREQAARFERGRAEQVAAADRPRE